MPEIPPKLPPRRTSKTGKPKAAPREAAPEQTESAKRFGISLLVGGGLCTVLPFVGLHLKQIGGPATIVVGLILLVIGGVSLVVSRSKRSADIATTGTKAVLWTIIGIGGSIILAVVLFFGYIAYAVISGPSDFGVKLKRLEGAAFEKRALEMLRTEDLENGHNRNVTLDALTKRTGTQPNEELAELLLSISNSPGPARYDAFAALANWGTPGTYPAIVEAAKNRDVDTGKAITVLKEIRKRYPSAPGLLDDEQVVIQLNAAWLVSPKIDGSFLKTVLENLQKDHPHAPNQRLTELLIKLLAKQKDTPIRIGVFKCLGIFGTKECIPILQAGQEKLKDESARQAAEEALAVVRAR